MFLSTLLFALADGAHNSVCSTAFKTIEHMYRQIFFLRLIHGQGLQVQHLLPISHHGTGATQPMLTEMVSAWTVYHEAQAALHPLPTAIQTQEQLENLLGMLQTIQ